MNPPPDRRALLLVPAVLVLLVAFVGPVGWLLARAFTQPQPGLQNFEALWQRQGYLQVLWNTIEISAMVTPICVLLGFPILLRSLLSHGLPLSFYVDTPNGVVKRGCQNR